MAKLYLVGAGPGSPDLLTVKAARLLRAADIVFHDALIEPGVLELIQGKRVSVGKRCGAHSTAQHFINKRLIDAAARYDCVVRLKGGDPMLFGRAQEEIDALSDAGIEVEIVPGISAAFAAAADLKVSLTRRSKSRSVVFVTPRVGDDEDPSDYVKSVLAADTAVVYMAGHETRQVARALIQGGRDALWPVAIVVGASSGRPEIIRTSLLRLAGGLDKPQGSGPALLCMGDVFATADNAAIEALESVLAYPSVG
jgi:uroporphyrin-III C-methyltransferase